MLEAVVVALRYTTEQACGLACSHVRLGNADNGFFMKFLSTRPMYSLKTGRVGSMISETFIEGVEKGDDWLYFARKFSSAVQAEIEGFVAEGWVLGYHACRYPALFAALNNGVENATNKKGSAPGVYWHETLGRGRSYHRYQLFRDGTAWAVVLLILTDPKANNELR